MSSKTPIKSESELEYEVFLSFRGSDTRDKFTDHLYVRLTDAGIRVYRDNEEIKKGENIGSELLEGIKRSKIAIPIFSKGYAESKWCLNELVKIVECTRSNGLKVMPVFYDVTPSEVRHQTGGYGKFFEAHRNTYNKNTIDYWKEALAEVGKLSGWDIHSDNSCRQEGQVVNEITNKVLRELKKAYMMVTDYLVGLEHHVEEILHTLNVEINGVKIIGIHGMGGIGKTTFAKVIYNHLLPHFESHCFLTNIRETIRSKGMEFLQQRLISDILKKEWRSISNIDEGIGIITKVFYNKKVLLILDDVDEINQLRALMGKRDCYGSGSRIIITTRKQDTIDWVIVDRSYELGGLDSSQALQLFSQHAFRSDKPPEEYTDLSLRIVEIAAGLPLALEVFGSLLCGKSEEQWRSKLKKWEKVSCEEVSAKLRISFEALDDSQKHVFLDIACFFIGEDERIAIYFWDDSEYPKEAIDVLQQMSLIKIAKDHSIWMHDQLRDLGRKIVQQEQNCNRLWSEEQIEKLFATKMISENIRGISNMKNGSKEASLFREDLARLPNLKLLSADTYGCITKWKFWEKSPPVFSNLRWLSWRGFPHNVYRSNFSVENLVMLELLSCRIESDWGGWKCIQTAKKLKVLNLTHCDGLVRTPDFSYHPLLERLIIDYCGDLAEIDESLGMLKHLLSIHLQHCQRLRKLPKKLCTESLEELIIDDTLIVEIPEWPTMKRLRVLHICRYGYLDKFSSLVLTASLTELSRESTRITALPDSLRNLADLRKFFLRRRKDLKTLPESIGDSLSLTELHLSDSGIVLPSNIELPQSLISLKAMWQDAQIPNLSSLINLKILELWTSEDGDYPFDAHDPAPWWIGRLTNLEDLSLSLGRITSLHADVGALFKLTRLKLSSCDQLQSIPKLPPSLKDLHIYECNSLPSLLDLPSGLKRLSIEDCSSLGTLLDLPSGLTSLSIERCSSLGTLLDLPSGLTILSIKGCRSLGTLLDLPSGLTSLLIKGCSSLGKLLDLPSGLKNLSICDCSSLGTLLDLPSGLKNLSISDCNSLGTLLDLPSGLKNLSISDCNSLGTLLDLPSGLTSLSIEGCSSLGTLLDLPLGLTSLSIKRCSSLGTLLDLPSGLKELVIWECVNLQRLPDLSNLKMLKELKVCSCPKLIEIPGRLKPLDRLEIVDCTSLERIPDIPKSESLDLYVWNCGKIKDRLPPVKNTVAALHRLFRNILLICCSGQSFMHHRVGEIS